MDGGSTDNTVEIIKKYEPWLTYWVSEKDKGQADAIAKGFSIASGSIIAWLNSDDYYLPNCFQHVAGLFASGNEIEIIMGGCKYITASGRLIDKNYGFLQDYDNLRIVGMFSPQPSMFWTKRSYLNAGGLETTLNFCMDYDLIIRLIKDNKAHHTTRMISASRLHDDAKSCTMQETLRQEDILIGHRYGRFELPSHVIDSIKSQSWRKYRNFQRYHFMLDAYCDPQFFIKHGIVLLMQKLKIRR